jgi:superfamily II DNA/RNA helicase
MRALAQLKFHSPTPVQAETIPIVQEGRDVLSTAQTGTGKTAAFVLPIMNRRLMGDKKQTLILAPTRELAMQIQKVVMDLSQYARQVKSGVIIGGAGYAQQTNLLRSNPAFVVGTPGRLIDQIKLGNLKLENFDTLVLDEADRLLDMGFEPQIEEIVAYLPRERQTLLFSATLPKEIEALARRYMKDPARVSIGAVSKPVEKIEQQVIHLTQNEKPEALLREIKKVKGSILVFTKTKYRTEGVARALTKAGYDVARIHGDRSQNQRNEAIQGFRAGQYRILVATDIAARGIDIPHIKYVINYDLPMAAEDYIHRIGRTARAGATGTAIAFVTPEEHLLWAKIHRLMYGTWPDDALRLAKERKAKLDARRERRNEKRDIHGGPPGGAKGGGHARGGSKPGSPAKGAGPRHAGQKPELSRAERRAKKFGPGQSHGSHAAKGHAPKSDEARRAWDQNEKFNRGKLRAEKSHGPAKPGSGKGSAKSGKPPRSHR